MAVDQDLNPQGRRQLARLARATLGDAALKAVEEVFDSLIPPGQRACAFPSYVTDDHTPFEFSVVLVPRASGGRAGLRVLAEPQRGATLPEFAEAARDVAKTLERRYGANLGRLGRVKDLFLTDSPAGAFAAWYAADFDAAGAPSFKIYLNPEARGSAAAPSLVEEMLDRLGMAKAWPFIAEATRRGPELDPLRFISLDLKDSATARVKVYAFHRHASFEDVDHAASQARYHDSERLRAFCRVITGGEGYFVADRDLGTCLSFVGNERPRTSTVHVPIRAFAGNDAIAKMRISLAATELGLDVAPYHAAVEAFASRPLEQGAGLHSYASLRSDEDGPRLNLYLSPELRETAKPRASVRPVASRPEPTDSPMDVVLRYERDRPITEHPFLKRLAREPVSLPQLALLLHNFREAITRDFSRRLAQLVARVDEDAIRCVLTKQLNDELGDGDFTRAHSLLFEELASGVAPYLSGGPSAVDLGPGRELGSLLEALYTTHDVYEGLGASLIMEVYGRQVDMFMGQQFRRGEALPAAVMEWLTLHETLEVEHVDESIDLARIIPEGWKARAASRGATMLAIAGWKFFDALDGLRAR